MANEKDAPPKPEDAIPPLRNPVVWLAFMMLLAIVLLIGAATLGWDKGLVLIKMGEVGFARGLITYLFAVVTIGTAVVLVVSALTSDDTPSHRRRFQRGKEILSLLLGVFGTIVGFYFGSEVASKGQPEETVIKIASPRLSITTAAPGAEFILTSYICGGRAPYKYGIGFDGDGIKPDTLVDASDWIVKTMTAPKVQADQVAQVHLVVEDADGHSAETSVSLPLKTGR